MAQVQVADDYGTGTCVLGLTHCASSWTLNRHVQRKHPQCLIWNINEKEKMRDIRPFTTNAAFVGAAYVSKAQSFTEVSHQAESNEIVSAIVEKLISGVFAQEERRSPKVIQADCQTLIESEATNWMEYMSRCRATVEDILSSSNIVSLKEIRDVVRSKWPRMTTREIDLTAMFTFVTSGLMAADSLALCDTEPTSLYFSQKSIVAQRALALRSSQAAWPFDECIASISERSEIRAADSGNPVNLLEWASCSKTPEKSKPDDSSVHPSNSHCESMLWDEALNPVQSSVEVQNPSFNQEPEPFEVTTIDFDPHEATTSVEACVVEKSHKAPKEAPDHSHGIRPSDVQGHNLGPCVEIVLERIPAEETFLDSNEVSAQLNEQIQVWASQGDDTRYVHIQDQSCTAEPEESTVMVATFAPLIDATHGRKPTKPARPVVPGARKKLQAKSEVKKDLTRRSSCHSFEHDRISKTIQRKLRGSTTSVMSIKDMMKYLNRHYGTDFEPREAEIAKLLHTARDMMKLEEPPQPNRMNNRNALEALSKVLKLPCRASTNLGPQSSTASDPVKVMQAQVESPPKKKIPSLLDMTISPPQGVCRQRYQPYAARDIADRVYKRLAHRNQKK